MAHSGKFFSMYLLFVASNLLVFFEHYCAYILFFMPLFDSGLYLTYVYGVSQSRLILVGVS